MSLAQRLASTLRRMADDLSRPEAVYVQVPLWVTEERWGLTPWDSERGAQVYVRLCDYPKAHRDALEPIPPQLRSDAAWGS